MNEFPRKVSVVKIASTTGIAFLLFWAIYGLATGAVPHTIIDYAGDWPVCNWFVNPNIINSRWLDVVMAPMLTVSLFLIFGNNRTCQKFWNEDPVPILGAVVIFVFAGAILVSSQMMENLLWVTLLLLTMLGAGKAFFGKITTFVVLPIAGFVMGIWGWDDSVSLTYVCVLFVIIAVLSFCAGFAGLTQEGHGTLGPDTLNALAGSFAGVSFGLGFGIAHGLLLGLLLGLSGTIAGVVAVAVVFVAFYYLFTGMIKAKPVWTKIVLWFQK